MHGLDQQKAAVQSGYWPLYRYNPDLVKQGKNPLQLDSKAPSLPLEKYIYNETRYTMLVRSNPEAAKELLALAAGGRWPSVGSCTNTWRPCRAMRKVQEADRIRR